MLKELFTFHSKEEDHRVMCLILVLLGVALLINPANAYTQFMEQTTLGTSNTQEYEGYYRPYFCTNNITTITSSGITKITLTGMGRTTGTSGTYYSPKFNVKGSNFDAGSGWVTWSKPTGGSEGVITIDIIPDHWHSNVYNDANCIEAQNSSQYIPDMSYNKTSGAGVYDNHATYPLGLIQCSSGNTAYCFAGGVGTAYTGGALPDAPVINDFTKDATCYAPAEAIVLESNVTGSVDSWLWEIYDSSDVQQWSSTDSVETIVDHVFAPGLYQVQLYVENTGGSDFLSKDNWLNITQAGGCGPVGNWTNPFPTTTITPSETLFAVVTVPQMANWNMTGVNDLINQSSLGNASIGYRQYWDKMAEQVNTTLLGSVYVVVSPFTTIVSAVSNGLTLFSTAYTSIIGYTTVPLQVVSIAISAMPWQIVSLITAGIAIDAILIIVLGVR